MAQDDTRSVRLDQVEHGRFRVTNDRGTSIEIGSGETAEFTPVELLLAAIGGCSSLDVDYITVKRSPAEHFTTTVSGDKIRDERGNRMTNLSVRFDVAFPDTDGGQAARDVLPKAVQRSHDRLCTVTRTVETGTPVDTVIADPYPAE